MLKKTISVFLSALLLAAVLPSAAFAAEADGTPLPQLTYQTHLSHIGWLDSVSSGTASGGEGEVIEALKLELDADDDLGLSYSGHVQNIGWQEPVTAGEIAGTTGRAYRMEAVKIGLTGADADRYDLFYRVEVAGFGWLGWAKNGETAGSENMAAAMQSIEIRLLPKDSSDAPQTGSAAALNGLSLSAKAHVAQLGWLDPVDRDTLIGTTGRGLQMESLSLSMDGLPSLGISYRVLMKGLGWSKMAEDGEAAGTTGQAIPLRAVQIKLTGGAADSFDLYYQAHVSQIGWLDWAKNGETAGVVDFDYRIEALRVTLVSKGSPAPGSTAVHSCEPVGYRYRSYLADSGWQEPVSGGMTSGTTGQAIPLRAFAARIDSDSGLGIRYSVHLSHLGWRDYVADGRTAGMENDLEQIEALRIRLTGAAASYYNVWYRVHSSRFGWLDWTCNGESAGTEGYGYAAEAVEVVILPIGSPAPGKTANPFYRYASEAARYADGVLDQIGRNLYAAFNWASGKIRYASTPQPPANADHAEFYGVYGFENHKGNCYVMASVFYWMANRLGYDAHLVEGSVPLRSGGMGPHSWCEIVINGATYVFDPDFTYETGKNGYQITYGTSGTWRYSNYRRVN